jgi:peptidoglycan/LPS O-acetylase OafA/YrhL
VNIKPRSIRLAPLDALRGFAALAVPAFTHFQHFGGDKALYPYDSLALGHWLYTYSQFFVDLFFVLSGFVLTFRYLEPLSKQRIDAREFFFLRFSRLYPLHLLTLLVCAGVEWSLMAQHQPTVIYAQDDLYHFLLHLTFVQLWFEHGLAYNYPSWSVCAEVFVYLLFFLFASKRPRFFWGAALLTIFVGVAVLSGSTLPLLNRNMSRALVGFFTGALAFQITERLDRAGRSHTFGISCLAALMTIVVIANRIGYDAWIGSDPLPYGLVLFPLLTVASLKVPPLAWLLSLRPLTFLGNISYAVYLSHVPIQMIVLAVTRARHVTIPTSNPVFFWAWIGTLVSVGAAVHYGFERPARKWLRGRLVDRVPASAAAPEQAVPAV